MDKLKPYLEVKKQNSEREKDYKLFLQMKKARQKTKTTTTCEYQVGLTQCLIHRLRFMVWLNGQGLERDMIGQLVKRNMETYVYRPLSEWEKNVNMFVSHVNGHQRLTSAEEDFNNQVDRMTSLVDISQLLSLATPSLPKGLMNKGP